MQTVIETSTYLTHAKQAGVKRQELDMIVDTIAAEPTAGDLIEGAGGARKLRWAKPGRGKSGGYRVITYFAGQDVPVFLLDIYGKGQKTNLTKAERNDLSAVLKMVGPAYRASAAAAAKASKTKGRSA